MPTHAPSKTQAHSGIRLAVALFALVILASACSPGPTTDPSAEPPASARPKTHTLTVPKNEADNVTAHGEVSCAALPDGVCPAGLAMSVARVDKTDVTKLSQCTAFLVTPDLVVTNSHCLPEDTRMKGASCANRLTFYFGKTADADAETAACDKVISVSVIASREQTDDFNLHPDVAFLKLKSPLARKPFKLSRAGVPNNASLTVFAIDPANTEHHLHGIARAKTCVAKQNSLVVPQYTNDFASVVSAACTVLPGNSGSPAVDANGNVRAILHGRRPVSMMKPEAYKGFRLPNQFDEMAFLTNVSCAAAPKALAGLGPMAAVCEAPVPTRLSVVREFERSRSIDVDFPFNSWILSAPKAFVFEIDHLSSNAGRVSMPRFKCIKPLSTWSSMPASDLKVDSLQITDAKISLGFTLPAWGPQPILDSSERIRIETGVVDRAAMNLTFDPRLPTKNGFIRVTETFASELGLLLGPATSTYDLAICK